MVEREYIPEHQMMNRYIHTYMHPPLASNHAEQANRLSRSERDCFLLSLHVLADDGAYGLDGGVAAAGSVPAAAVLQHGGQKCSSQP